MRGSILLTFDELVDDLGIDYITITVAGQERYIRYIDSNTIYTTLVNTGDVSSVSIYSSPTDLGKQISIIRRDYTTDDQGGDNGIRDTFITSSSGRTNPITVTFTATTTSDTYGFKYIITSIFLRSYRAEFCNFPGVYYDFNYNLGILTIGQSVQEGPSCLIITEILPFRGGLGGVIGVFDSCEECSSSIYDGNK